MAKKRRTQEGHSSFFFAYPKTVLVQISGLSCKFLIFFTSFQMEKEPFNYENLVTIIHKSATLWKLSYLSYRNLSVLKAFRVMCMDRGEIHLIGYNLIFYSRSHIASVNFNKPQIYGIHCI